MHRQLHVTPAVAAVTFVLCLAGFAFVVVALLPSPNAQQLLSMRSVGTGALQVGKLAAMVIVVGYAAGIVGWLATFGLRCDGMHRLSSVLERPRYK